MSDALRVQLLALQVSLSLLCIMYARSLSTKPPSSFLSLAFCIIVDVPPKIDAVTATAVAKIVMAKSSSTSEKPLD